MAALDSDADDDAVEIDRCRAGDTDGYRVLFERHRNAVYRVAYRLVGHKEDALDLTQEAFVRAFASLDRFRREASFKTYLTRIAVNVCLDFRRRSRPQNVALDEEQVGAGGPREAARAVENAPPAVAQSHELERALRDAVADLPEAQRTAFLLHTEEGLTYAQVAAHLEVPVGTVMSRIYYARKRVQESIGPVINA